MGPARGDASRDLSRRPGRKAPAAGGAAMILSLVLWCMVWGGVFTGLYNLTPPPSIHDPLALFQGARALLPVMAAYFCLLWALATRARFRFGLTSLGFLCCYGALGLLASVFYSPDKVTALYWGSAYIAPLLAAWFITERPDPLPILRTVLRLNAAVIVLLMLAVLPEAYRFGFGRATRFEIYIDRKSTRLNSSHGYISYA